MRATDLRGMRIMMSMVIEADQEKLEAAELEASELDQYIAALSGVINGHQQMLDLSDENLLAVAHCVNWPAVQAAVAPGLPALDTQSDVRGMRSLLRRAIDMDLEERRIARLDAQLVDERIGPLREEIEAIGRMLELDDERLKDAAERKGWELLQTA